MELVSKITVFWNRYIDLVSLQEKTWTKRNSLNVNSFVSYRKLFFSRALVRIISY